VQNQYQSTYHSGQYLFSEGDDGDCAFIIEKGSVEVYLNKQNKKMIIATLSSGDLVGEMAIIDRLPRTASAVALEDTDVIVIPREYVSQKIEYSDATVRFFLKVIMERYRDMHARLMRVFEGINPDESDYSDMYASTKNVVQNLMDQYLDMQDRIMTAVNTAVPLNSPIEEDADVTRTKMTLGIEKGLQDALENSEFELHYQPIIELKTGTIKGCEALIRWLHPERGLIGPFEFIPHAENTGLIIPLGYWIVQQACQFQQIMSDKYAEDFFTTINLSSKQFESPNLTTKMDEYVSRFASSANCIKFEITESLLMTNPELASASLNELKETGIKLAIDDFGTGYSSLSYLHRFPFDTLKIDRSFVSTMLQNKKSNEIVKSLIDLSHNLGMDVVAEGIETTFEEKIIKNYQAEFGQGFLYAKPVTAEEFKKLLQ
jgi:EAL domain-containing protein (putative c-di-GMP-specific phosphodiesterase class I)/CRP-like cAMP-binding protein